MVHVWLVQRQLYYAANAVCPGGMQGALGWEERPIKAGCCGGTVGYVCVFAPIGWRSYPVNVGVLGAG